MTIAWRPYFYIAVFLSLAVFVALSFATLAKAFVGLKIQPVKVSETLNPGQSYKGSINLTNESDEDVNLLVTVQDFIPLAGSETIQFVERAPGVTTVKDWIDIVGPMSFIFAKGESRRIEYSINAPETADPGGHFGAIFFKGTAKDSGEQLKIGTQIGMLVLVTVPGNRIQKGRILSFSAPAFVEKPPVDFTLRFENTGTVHFEPKGEIIITNMLGQRVGEVPIEGQVVLPTGIKDLHFAWHPAFIFGKYIAKATIYDGEGNQLTSEFAGFWAFQIGYVVSFFVVVLLLYILLRFIRRRLKISVSLK